MSYVIFSRGRDHPNTVEISQDEYDRINRSISIVVELVGAEEIYDSLISSYAELEKDLLCASVDFALFHEQDETTVRARKNDLVRRASAFLSAARTYVDSIGSRFEKAAQGALDLAKTLMRQSYDGQLGYRVCEGLRNHAQHRGHITEQISFGSTSELDRNEDRIWIFTTVLKLDIEDLVSQDAFKAHVRDELLAGDAMIDLMPLVRQYMQCFSDIQNALREHANAAETEAIEYLSSAIERLSERLPRDAVKFPAIGRALEDGTIDDIRNLHILENPYRTFLKRKNARLYHLPSNSFRS